jgi:hypothetical protein
MYAIGKSETFDPAASYITIVNGKEVIENASGRGKHMFRRQGWKSSL